MTDAQIEQVYKDNLDHGRIDALRAVFSAGYICGTGGTPASTLVDKSRSQASFSTTKYSGYRSTGRD